MTLTKLEQNIGAVISSLAIALLSFYLSFSILSPGDEIGILITLGAIVVIAFGLSFFVIAKLRHEHKLAEIDYLNIGVQRYILGLFMVFYGVPKLFGTFFDYQLFALDSKLVNVSEFELAWYYFGKNKWQELFAGVMEFIPGLLLLNRRTYYVGSLILLPVTAQVFILNLFFKIGGVTFPAATILLACNGYLIYTQKENIVQFFKSLQFSHDINLGRKSSTIIKICRGIIFVFVALVLFINIKPALFKGDQKKKYEKLIGVYSLETMTKNHLGYTPTNDSTIYKDLYIEKQSRWNILRKCNNEVLAFIMDINTSNDSMLLYLNKGGIGDDADIIDTMTVLKGVYTLEGNNLTINGVQLTDTLMLVYKKQEELKPKEWFW